MTPDQLTFDLPLRAASGRKAFFVAPGNALAVAEIDRWQSWPAGKLALVGPEGAGKSHLAAVWATETQATIVRAPERATPDALPRYVVVEDADTVAGRADAEQALLHLHNRTLERGGALLLTSQSPPARWPVALPDLASRLGATHVARLEAPDDTLLGAVLSKLFADRQLRVGPEVIRFCVARMERSHRAAQALVAEMDARALATGRPLGRKLAAEVLDAAP